MNPSSDADIRAALEPYAPAFANEHAREQFIRLNPGLAEVSPALLPELVKARLSSPEHKHFLKPPAPQYAPGSVDEIEANWRARFGGQPQAGGLAKPGPLTLDQVEQQYAQNQSYLATTGIGLGGQRRAPK